MILAILSFLFACAPADTGTDADNDTDCNDNELVDGLTLIDLPTNKEVIATILTEDGEVQQESQISDACGVVTFDVDPEEFGSWENDWEWGVFATIPTEEEYDSFHGVVAPEGGEIDEIFPISTQWECEYGEECVVVRDPKYGLAIGEIIIW